MFIAGFFLLAGLPVVLDWSELHAGPERAGGAAGFLLLAGNLGGVVLVLIIQAVIGNPYLSLGALSVACLAGLALATRLPARGAARITREGGSVVTDPMADLERQLKPYRDQFPSFRELPAEGLARTEVTGLVERLASAEERTWRDGYASGAVYHGDPEHVAFLGRIYAAQSQSNPLHPDLWPSATKFEAEIVAMTASMLEPAMPRPETPVVGTVSSGGTESILLAMKAYRDFARERRGIAAPEIVAPVTAHAAFDKAARFFDMPLVRVPVDGKLPGRSGCAGRCRDRADGRGGGVGADVPARRDRPDPRDRGAGGRTWRGLSRRRLPRRVHPAVGGAARLPGTAL